MTTIDTATTHPAPARHRNSKHGAAALALACALACLAMLGLVGCGSGSPDSPSEVVARVGLQLITKGMINQWMTPIAGEDYYAVTTHPAPSALVAEPADYPACVTALKKLIPIPGQGKPQPQQTSSDLNTRCHSLYQAIRYQTTTLLVGSYWNMRFVARHGDSVTSEEIGQLLKRELGTTQERQSYIESHRRTLAEQLLDQKLKLLQQHSSTKPKPSANQATSNSSAKYKPPTHKSPATPEYIVEHRKGFKAPGRYPGLPPAVQFQEIGRWRPETSHGFTGHPVP
jgi:hypothetical protein